MERISRLDVSKLCRPPRHISPDQAASASPNAGAVCFDGAPGRKPQLSLSLLSGLIPGRASVGSPGYPSLTTAILARDRIDFATGLHRLHYRRKSGAIACRTFVLDRFHGWLFHLNPFRRAPQLGIANGILDYVVEAFDEIVDPLTLIHEIAKRAVELLAISIARYHLKRPQRRRLCALGHAVTSPRVSASLSIQLLS